MKEKNLKVYVDGGSRGNPGEAAIGGAIFLNEEEKPAFTFSKKIGIATNNEAEYKAIIEALTLIKNKFEKVNKIKFFLDSRLVVNQLNGFFKVKKGKFREFIFKIRVLEQEIGADISYQLVPREKNKLADKLVNLAFTNP